MTRYSVGLVHAAAALSSIFKSWSHMAACLACGQNASTALSCIVWQVRVLPLLSDHFDSAQALTAAFKWSMPIATAFLIRPYSVCQTHLLPSAMESLLAMYM